MNAVLNARALALAGGAAFALINVVCLVGHAVAGAGDVNGDGYDDVIIGAPFFNADEGRVYVYLGSSSGLGPNGTPANADWVVSGGQADAWFGYSVAGADVMQVVLLKSQPVMKSYSVLLTHML